jgi:hypothetical protein
MSKNKYEQFNQAISKAVFELGLGKDLDFAFILGELEMYKVYVHKWIMQDMENNCCPECNGEAVKGAKK